MILHSGLKPVKIMFIMIYLNMLTETNSIYVYLIEVW